MRVRVFSSVLCAFFLFPSVGFSGEPQTITGKNGSPMALVPAGDFLMGSPEEHPYLAFPAHERPRHEVSLDSFYIDIYEVTNKQYAEFLSDKKPELSVRRNWVVTRDDIRFPFRMWPTEIEMKGDTYMPVKGFENFPVLAVSWHGADSYCRWAGKRLPTEAEWEKAARGGRKDNLFPWGDAIPTDGVVFKRKWTDNYYPAPAETVGNYHSNGYGIYDMAGNVWEWCSDWYSPDYYKGSPRKNPRGPSTGISKVIRGGSWVNTGIDLRVANRRFSLPKSLDSGIGFRCVKEVGNKE